jgi:hypothetical protein
MERTEERAVSDGGKGAKPCGIVFGPKNDPEGGEAVEMGGSSVGVAGAMEQDVFLGVPVWPIWVRRVELGVVRVGAWAEGGVVRSLSEAVGVVGVEGVICRPSEYGGRDEAAFAFCCGSDGRRRGSIRGGVAGDE